MELVAADPWRPATTDTRPILHLHELDGFVALLNLKMYSPPTREEHEKYRALMTALRRRFPKKTGAHR